MIRLGARNPSAALTTPLDRRVWRLIDATTPPRAGDAYLVESAGAVPAGYALYVTTDPECLLDAPGNAITVAPTLDYLRAGDVIAVTDDGSHTTVLWRHDVPFNSVLLTEQCDNYCLMCSQPPKERPDPWVYRQAVDLVDLLPSAAGELCFTGGEPTLDRSSFVELLTKCRDSLPETDIHILSNGRRFADREFATAYADIANPRMMVGIPIYGTEPNLHDYVVQAPGAFNETIAGILNLAALDQPVELRVVIHRRTAAALPDIADFVARNLPFVDHVALMGLEMMGLARHNLHDVWIDPVDYSEELVGAVRRLDGAGVPVQIYNHQLCLIDPSLWPYAVKSISDWKNEYLTECTACSQLNNCGGLFSSATYKRSPHIAPIAQGPAAGEVRGSPVQISVSQR